MARITNIFSLWVQQRKTGQFLARRWKIIVEIMTVKWTKMLKSVGWAYFTSKNICYDALSHMESHWAFYEYRVSLFLVLSCCSVGTLPVLVTFSSDRWDCACLSGCFLTLPDCVCPWRDSCARDGSGHGLSCFHTESRISNINTHLLLCSFLNLEIVLSDDLSVSDIEWENCVAKVPAICIN